MLIEAKKPIIAHNPQYDVAFVYEQFIGPLPESFLEFCAEWKKHFPAIYDTKCVFYELTKDIGANKSVLLHIYGKVMKDSKFVNNLVIAYDKESDPAFGNYE